MKKFSFKSNEPIIKGFKEQQAQKKRRNYDRIFFIAIMAIVLFFIARYAYNRFFIIRANSQIEFEKLNVSFTDDIRLLKLNISEGDEVEKGDTLFRYMLKEREGNSYTEIIDIENNKDRINREIDRLITELEMKKIEKRSKETLVSFYVEKEKELVKQVMLEVYPKAKLGEMQDEIFRIKSTIVKLRAEIELLHTAIWSQRNKLSNPTIHSSSYSQLHNIETSYVTPEKGIIGIINFNENEICYQSENVLTIHNSDSVKIVAFFDPRDIKLLKIGTTVNINFQDGTESKGVIKNFLVSTYALPAEFQKKYEPVTRSVVALISPTNEHEGEVWKGFYKMNVEVSFNKLRLLFAKD